MAHHAAGGKGIGGGRLRAAALEADRTRQRTGAVRPHLQYALPINPRQRAAALTHRGHGDGRNKDREIPDDFAVALRHPAVDDHRHVGAGAADIQAENFVKTAGAGEIAGTNHAGGGAGEHHLHAFALRLVNAHHPAVGFSNARRRLHAKPFQRLLKGFQVVDHHRLHVGVDGGGNSAFIFADDRPDVGGTGGQQFRRHLIDNRFYRRFIVPVAIAVQQRDHDALTAGGTCLFDSIEHALAIHGLQYVALRVAAFADGKYPVAGNQRCCTP